MNDLRLPPVTLPLPCPACGRAIHATYGQVIDEATVT